MSTTKIEYKEYREQSDTGMLAKYSHEHYSLFMNVVSAFKSTGETSLLHLAAKMSRASMQAIRDKARFQGFKKAKTRRVPVKKKK